MPNQVNTACAAARCRAIAFESKGNQVNPLHPIIEAQCFIVGCMLHRCGYNLASPIAIMIAGDLHRPLPDRKLLGHWGDSAAVWDVDITEVDDLEQMMERAAPVLAALHQGMVLGSARIANHMRWLAENADVDILTTMLLYQNCVPFMRDGRGVPARAKRVMHDLLDEIINEPDAHVERFASLASEASHVTKGWSKYRLRGNAVAPVVELPQFFLEIMQSFAHALNETAERMRQNGVPPDFPESPSGVMPTSGTSVTEPPINSETAIQSAQGVTEPAQPREKAQCGTAAVASDESGCAIWVVLALIGVGVYLLFR